MPVSSVSLLQSQRRSRAFVFVAVTRQIAINEKRSLARVAPSFMLVHTHPSRTTLVGTLPYL